MDALIKSKTARLVSSLVYSTGVIAAAMWFGLRKPVTVPLMMISLGLPLIFRLVPRNYLYGMRSPRTLWTTEEIWYRQNVITGVVMVVFGVIWLGVLAVR
jgi:uncharacterized protein (DUF486 family)